MLHFNIALQMTTTAPGLKQSSGQLKSHAENAPRKSPEFPGGGEGESHHAALGSTIYRTLQELRGPPSLLPPSYPPPTHIQAANMPPKSKKTSADLSLAIILVVFRVASHK